MLVAANGLVSIARDLNVETCSDNCFKTKPTCLAANPTDVQCTQICSDGYMECEEFQAEHKNLWDVYCKLDCKLAGTYIFNVSL